MCQLVRHHPGSNSEASSFRTLRWSSSGPKALDGFKPLRGLVTPTAETTIPFMKGADRFGSGTWLCLFLLNTFVNWPLNSSAYSSSNSATPLPFLLLRAGMPWVSFFWPFIYLGLALMCPTKLLTSSFRYELKSVAVRFGTHRSPFRYFRRSVPAHFGPFRSVSVNRDTA